MIGGFIGRTKVLVMKDVFNYGKFYFSLLLRQPFYFLNNLKR